jgi:cytochrome c553
VRALTPLRTERTPGARLRRASWKLTHARLRVALAALAATLLFVGAVGAQHRIGASGDVAAKISYCKDCHGVSAQGFNGYYPIPRLAGQQREYIENQLRAFTEHRRTNNIMFNVAHSLSPAMINALTAHFASLNPPPIGGAPRQKIATGRKIFEDGMPEVNIAACAACHGPEATGSGQIPRLAGQLYPYMIN